MFYHHNRKVTNVYDQDQVGLISVWGENPCQQSSPPPQPTLFIEVASLTESETQQSDKTSYPSKHRRSSWLYLSGIRTIGTYILPCLAFWHGCWGIWTYVCAVGTLWTEILSQPSYVCTFLQHPHMNDRLKEKYICGMQSFTSSAPFASSPRPTANPSLALFWSSREEWAVRMDSDLGIRIKIFFSN